METTHPRYNRLNALALVLVLPTVYFLSISVLKYEMGINGPFDSVAPFLESMGLKENLGWNINLLILLGPVVALLIAAWQTIHINWHPDSYREAKEQVHFNMIIRKKKFPLFILFLSGLVLTSLFIYLVGENLIVRE